MLYKSNHIFVKEQITFVSSMFGNFTHNDQEIWLIRCLLNNENYKLYLCRMVEIVDR